ncbi:ATP synthase F1 subunit gamma [Mycoplasmopsis gallinacea]|uniref:ATP synthase gamma chain n=1 Tax=Mycoplasmopsis gallinacea TaxID=29556 RepID=A0A449A2P3_9BACT|nr:ATP synthase F1 subunit gamma [Mycoplasmopsis gallinacea]VEU58463.1 ATP synthase F1, gamma subunit [Mycoplasmopsis gallinacea]
MSNLNALKNRIGVVTNTKKITNAMQLVAASKLRKAREQAEKVKSYQDILELTFHDLITNISPNDFKSVFPSNDEVENSLYIVITSDLGLCGSYNSNIVHLIENKIKPNDKLIVLGTKGLGMLLEKFKNNIVDHYTNYGDTVPYKISDKITKLALKLYHEKQIRNINLVYTKFVNNILQEAEIKKIFPFDISNDSRYVSYVEFEPNPETILKNSIPLYIASMIYTLGTASKVSELAARRNAMENATDNAEDLIQALSLEFNRSRQSIITQEINEIVSGADAT